MIVIGGSIFVGGAATLVTAFANTGNVSGGEDCVNWSVTAHLDNNVANRWVTVTWPNASTFVIQKAFTTTSSGAKDIFKASGSSPEAGTITEIIFKGATASSGPENTYTLSITPPTDCKAQPSIETDQSAGGPVGTVIHDTATVTGGHSPTGTVTFKLYGAGDTSCGSDPVYTDTQTLTAGSATSGNYTTTAVGTYSWTATYNGDANNDAAASGCELETTRIIKASPGINTVPSDGGPVGTAIHDTANVTGGFNPTGSVTFRLYAPAASPCDEAAPVFTDTKTLTAGSATSGNYTTTVVGTYRWRATYGGDANNNGASSGCQAETVTIAQATPAISTKASAGGTVGIAVTDSATVTGGDSPTGTVTFKLFGAGDTSCDGTPVFIDTKTLQAGSATSGSYTTAAVGTYSWIATYNGDANNASISSKCGNELVTTTAAHASGVQAVSTTTPNTGEAGTLREITAGGILLAGGLGSILLGLIVRRRAPRPRRTRR